MATVEDRATLARDLITQLHKALLTRRRPAGLEPALCAYVAYWHARGSDTTSIESTIKHYIDRVSTEHLALEALDAAAFEAMAQEILAHCLTVALDEGNQRSS